jgi:hypothetical protein
MTVFMYILQTTARSISMYQIVAFTIRIGTEHIGSDRIVPGSYHKFHTIRPERNHDTTRGKLEYEPRELNLDTTVRTGTVRPDAQ